MPRPRKAETSETTEEIPLIRGVPATEYDAAVREWASDMGAPADETAVPDPEPVKSKPKRAPRKRKTAATEADEPAAPPPPPTECRQCHAPFTWRDKLYVPERARILCKRCFDRAERERITHGRLVKPAPNKGGANRAQRRAAGVRNPEPMRLELARAAKKSSGRRAHKRHHVPCLCCWRPESKQKQRQRGAA